MMLPMHLGDDPRHLLYARLERGVTQQVFPGCVALVACGRSVIYHEAHGSFATVCGGSHVSPMVGEPLHTRAVFDLASLTKVLATTTLLAQAVTRQEIDLHGASPLWAHRPGLTYLDLLEHCSGLLAHEPFFSRFSWPSASSRAAIFRAVDATPASAPRRQAAVYSDLGFITLTQAIEQHYGRRIDQLFTGDVVERLGLDLDDALALRYAPLDRHEDEVWPAATASLSRVAPSEVYDFGPDEGEQEPPWLALRKRFAGPEQWAWGQVHDDNAFCMLGVSGHAGLFGTAMGVYELALGWLEPSRLGLSLATRDRFWQRSTVAGSSRCVGWDGVDPLGNGSTGRALGAHAVGHLGYTGCSLWIEPRPDDTSRVFILLAHRVHPRRGAPEPIRQLRQDFHALASAMADRMPAFAR